MSGECVKVVVRCRPMNTKEKNLSCAKIVKIDQSILQVTLTKPRILGSELAAGKAASDKAASDSADYEPKSFTFDGVYDDDSKQRDVYDETAYPLLQSVMEGYNGTIFAYGQTGCGKSFTMEGKRDVPELKGIIPNTFADIFNGIDANAAPGRQFLVRASYIEIYNEEVRDLTSENPKGRCEVKEDKDKGVYIKGLNNNEVRNVDELEALMNRGNSNRTVGATLMNADSSRSHSIFTITVECSDPDTTKGGDEVKIKQGKLNLVDLAGSERQSKTAAEGVRLKEATKINLSLSALGNVIEALVANASGKSRHIPYRDSKLTRLLSDSLGGNTKTIMIAALSPADYNYDETLSTLRYANRAKNIKNKPKINEDPKDALLREYQDEIKRLKLILEEKGLGDLLSSMPSLAASVSAPKAAPKAAASKAPVKAVTNGSQPTPASPSSNGSPLASARATTPTVDSEEVASALTGADAAEREAQSVELANDLDRLADEKQHHERLAAVIEMELANRDNEAQAIEVEKQEIDARIQSEAAAGKEEIVALLEAEKARLESEHAAKLVETDALKATMAAEKAEHEAMARELESEMSAKLEEEAARRREIEDKLTFIKEKTVKEKESLKNKLKLLQEKLLSGHERIRDIKHEQEEKLRAMKENQLALRKKQAELEEERRKQEEEALFLEEKYQSSEAELVDVRAKLAKLARRYRTLESEKSDVEEQYETEKEARISEVREAEKDAKLYQQICERILTSTDLATIVKMAQWQDGREEWQLPNIDIPVVFPTVHAMGVPAPAPMSPTRSTAQSVETHTGASYQWRRPAALAGSSAIERNFPSSNGRSAAAQSVLDRLRSRQYVDSKPSYYVERSAGDNSWKRSVLARLSTEELEVMAREQRGRGPVSRPSQPAMSPAEARAHALAVSDKLDAITAGVKRREAFQGGKVAEESKDQSPDIYINEIDAAVRKRPAFSPAHLVSTGRDGGAHVLPESALAVPARPAFSPAPLTPASPKSPTVNFDALPKGRPAFAPGKVS